MLKVTGLNEQKKKLEEVGRKLRQIDGQRIPITDLLTPEFVTKHTNFANAEEMFNASGFKVETNDDIAKIPDGKWDEFIRSSTSFSDWHKMLGSAGDEWAGKQLGL